MSKVKDYDLNKERIELQKFTDEVQQLLNTGSLEVEITNASAPAYDAPNETHMVLSIFGGQFRFYISYLGDWYYTTLTKLP